MTLGQLCTEFLDHKQIIMVIDDANEDSKVVYYGRVESFTFTDEGLHHDYWLRKLAWMESGYDEDEKWSVLNLYVRE